MKNLIKNFPVRAFSAIAVFGQACVLAVAFVKSISPDAVAVATGLWTSFMGVVGSIFVHGAVTPNATVATMVTEAAKPPEFP